MIPVLRSEEMRAADRFTIERVGLPGAVLMENAGAAVARVIEERFARAGRIAILCGKGNNGGDGFVVARRLLSRRPEVCLVGATRAGISGDAALHLAAYVRSGGALSELTDVDSWQGVRERVLGADVVVDALLGTGLEQAPRGLAARVIRDLAGARGAVVAVDLPSGLSSDSGEQPWDSVAAALTVTFAAPKYGHVLPPACGRVGELVIADIGIPRKALETARLFLLERADAARPYGQRPAAAHKGDYGHVLVIAGSIGKTGAAVMAAEAALRAGAGLVTVATPAPALPLVAAGHAEVMTEPLAATPSGGIARRALEPALALARDRDAVVLGPGLGQDPSTRELVRRFVPRCPVPLLVDADGLNALARAPKAPSAVGVLARAKPTVVTPHPGEMARLAGATTREILARRLERTLRFAKDTGVHVVLKGHRSLIADPQGRAAVNPTGNPGMAGGGMGDVLSGMIGALLARGADAWTAATAGVYLHGLAGDLVAARRGQEGLLAGDVIAALAEAIGCAREGSFPTR